MVIKAKIAAGIDRDIPLETLVSEQLFSTIILT